MFYRAQFSAFLATAADFMVMVLCYQFLGLPLAIAVGLGPLVGGGVNFFLNRHWSFRAGQSALTWQLSSYMSVCLVSAVANVKGVLMMVEYTTLTYLPARVIVAVVVALIINYPLHRYLVFAGRGRLLKDQQF